MQTHPMHVEMEYTVRYGHLLTEATRKRQASLADLGKTAPLTNLLVSLGGWLIAVGLKLQQGAAVNAPAAYLRK